ncbi:MAG: glycosyltransferase [Nitrospinae bacterium]|nr:glycosyltransferase [Nitrospinota bacterium]
MPFKELKVAIVHYWFVNWRGGEKVIESLLKLFPQADIYTLFYDPGTVPGTIKQNHRIISSCLNNYSFLRKNYQKVFPLYPLGIKSLSLKNKNYDLVISNESGPAKGIELPKGAKHICFCQTPMRYCWGFREEYLRDLPFPVRQITDLLFERLREWDKTTIHNVDQYWANSNNVQERIQRFYGLDSIVMHPPVGLELFEDAEDKNFHEQEPFYLLFGALTPYKRADIAVKAFNSLKSNLVIIGKGSEEKKIKVMAANNIILKGALPDNEIKNYLKHAEALIFPGEEDFGIVPLESQAQGTPVIAFGKGGVLDTVRPHPLSQKKGEKEVLNPTGFFFHEQTPESLSAAVSQFETIKKDFKKEELVKHARTFGEDIFLKRVISTIKDFLANEMKK